MIFRGARAAALLAVLSAGAVATALVPGCGDGGGTTPGSCPNDLPPACPSPAPTFAADAEPVIAAKCRTCHAPNGVEANRPFLNYNQIFAQRSGMLNQVHACLMPPGDAPQLTAAERLALQGWLVCGALNN